MSWFRREPQPPPQPRVMSVRECCEDMSATVAEYELALLRELRPISAREVRLVLLAVACVRSDMVGMLIINEAGDDVEPHR